jgi:HEAT repeat protein
MNANDSARSSTTGDNEIAELLDSLASKDGIIRQHAREKLENIGKPAVMTLIVALDDHRDQVRWEAAKTLVVIADHRAAPALVKHLQDEDFDVRWLAAEALIALQEEALPTLLGELELHSNSIRLREGAHHVLKKLKNEQVALIVKPVLEALNKLEPELTVPVAVKTALYALQHQLNVSNQ